MHKLHRLWQYPAFVLFCALSIIVVPIAGGLAWVAVRVGHEIIAVEIDEEEALPV